MVRRITSPILVGRAAETQAFDLALVDAGARRASIILIGGEAGAGKSRLLAELAARGRSARGAAVIGSATPPAGGVHPPFAALTPILRGLVRSLDARLIEPLLGTARRDLAALLPELGPAPATTDDLEPFAAARLAEATLKAIEVVARHRSLVVIAMDDLQWTDEATRRIVTFLGRNLLDVPVVLCLAYRSDALLGDDGLMALVSELARSPNAERLELRPLAAEEVVAQVRAILGAEPEHELMNALVRRANGNPFFVEELLAAIVEGGPERPPPSVRAMTEAKLSRVGDDTRQVVEIVAVAGDDVPPDIVAAASGLSTADFDRAVREAHDVHLLTLSSEGAGPFVRADASDRIGMRHELVREVIVRSLTSPRRRELHAALAAVIRTGSGSWFPSRLEERACLALHYLLAGETTMGIRELLEEAAEAERARAFVVAHQAYVQALETWRAHGEDSALADLDRAGVLVAAARAASLAGDAAAAVGLAEQALSAPQANRDVTWEARVQLHLGRYLAAAGLEEAASAALQRAFDAAGDDPLLRVRCGIELARRWLAVRRFDLAVVTAASAAADAARLGALRESRQAHAVEALALARQGRLDEAVAAARRSGRPAPSSRGGSSSLTRPSRFSAEIDGYLEKALALEQAGDPEAAARAALEGGEAAGRMGLSATAGALMSALAARDLLWTGAWSEAEAALRRPGLERGPAVPEVALVAALLASRRGDRAAASDGLAAWQRGAAGQVRDGWRAFGHYVEAEHAWRERRLGDARTAVSLAMLAAEAELDPLVSADAALLGIRIEADTISVPGRTPTSDLETARETATRLWLGLERRRHRPSGTIGARDAAVLATVAALLGGIDGRPSADAWGMAVEAWDRVPDPYAAATARIALAEALIASGDARERARDTLRAASLVADDLGCEPLAAAIGHLARRGRLGPLRLADPSDTAGLPSGYAEARRLGLSERESEVLSLIAEGRSDREIASELFISTKTAGHHVSHVLAKLGVSRRGEAAAVAYRIGLVPTHDGDEA